MRIVVGSDGDVAGRSCLGDVRFKDVEGEQLFHVDQPGGETQLKECFAGSSVAVLAEAVHL